MICHFFNAINKQSGDCYSYGNSNVSLGNRRLSVRDGWMTGGLGRGDQHRVPLERPPPQAISTRRNTTPIYPADVHVTNPTSAWIRTPQAGSVASRDSGSTTQMELRDWSAKSEEVE
jgi:hypothetical protein